MADRDRTGPASGPEGAGVARCLRCQHDNPADAAFCDECGTRLAVACPGCGEPNRGGAKFCRRCGQGLVPPSGATPGLPSKLGAPESYIPRHLAAKILTAKSALEGERKQVTILFADLKGSMELLADRDPEEARKLLDPVLFSLGILKLDQGDFVGALAPLERGFELCRTREVPALLHDFAWALGAAYHGTGRRVEGVALMEDAVRGFADQNLRWSWWAGRVGALAGAYLLDGRPADAIRVAKDGLATALIAPESVSRSGVRTHTQPPHGGWHREAKHASGDLFPIRWSRGAGSVGW
jgi:Double zinc ribbon